jgi:hypothetical protein
MMRTARTATGWLLVVVFGGLATGVAPAYAAAVNPPPLFTFADTQIDESSGLGTSSYGDGIVYTHNDSGDTARFFAVNSSGATVAIYSLQGASAHDWEDMETGTDSAGRPVLYFGDIGDNSSKRSEIDVYQVPEPRGPSANVPWVRYRFHYPDGPHNAETLMVDPHTHRIYIATKFTLGLGTLYEAPATLSTTDLNVLVPVRSGIPVLTTSGDISPNGKLMVLLTYFSAYWAVGVNGTLHAFPIPEQKQDEAIAFTRDGRSVIVGSEGVHSAVYQVPLPAAALAAAPPPPPSPTPTASVAVKKPTPKPTPKPLTSTSPTRVATSALASVSAAASSPAIGSSAPASSALSSLLTSGPATSPAAASSSGAAQLQTHTQLTSRKNSWLRWVVLAVVVCILGGLLPVARAARIWPFRSRAPKR